jgi:hypothetical protein
MAAVIKSWPRNYFQITALTFCGTKGRSELDQIAEAAP